jgi:flagellar motor switch protein FliN/FliY
VLPLPHEIRLGRGSIIELDRGPGTPLDVRVNGVLIGRGEVVLVNEERLGLRFVEVVSQAERAKRLG